MAESRPGSACRSRVGFPYEGWARPLCDSPLLHQISPMLTLSQAHMCARRPTSTLLCAATSRTLRRSCISSAQRAHFVPRPRVQGKSRKVFFAVAGLPRDKRNFDGTPSDEAVVHALPVVVIVDDVPAKAALLPSPPPTPEPMPQPALTANISSLMRWRPAARHPAPRLHSCLHTSCGPRFATYCHRDSPAIQHCDQREYSPKQKVLTHRPSPFRCRLRVPTLRQAVSQDGLVRRIGRANGAGTGAAGGAGDRRGHPERGAGSRYAG